VRSHAHWSPLLTGTSVPVTWLIAGWEVLLETIHTEGEDTTDGERGIRQSATVGRWAYTPYFDAVQRVDGTGGHGA
jgi:hypothetical protein